MPRAPRLLSNVGSWRRHEHRSRQECKRPCLRDEPSRACSLRLMLIHPEALGPHDVAQRRRQARQTDDRRSPCVVLVVKERAILCRCRTRSCVLAVTSPFMPSPSLASNIALLVLGEVFIIRRLHRRRRSSPLGSRVFFCDRTVVRGSANRCCVGEQRRLVIIGGMCCPHLIWSENIWEPARECKSAGRPRAEAESSAADRAAARSIVLMLGRIRRSTRKAGRTVRPKVLRADGARLGTLLGSHRPAVATSTVARVLRPACREALWRRTGQRQIMGGLTTRTPAARGMMLDYLSITTLILSELSPTVDRRRSRHPRLPRPDHLLLRLPLLLLLCRLLLLDLLLLLFRRVVARALAAYRSAAALASATDDER